MRSKISPGRLCRGLVFFWLNQWSLHGGCGRRRFFYGHSSTVKRSQKLDGRQWPGPSTAAAAPGGAGAAAPGPHREGARRHDQVPRRTRQVTHSLAPTPPAVLFRCGRHSCAVECSHHATPLRGLGGGMVARCSRSLFELSAAAAIVLRHREPNSRIHIFPPILWAFFAPRRILT